MGERELIERIRRGDREAPAVLVREHSGTIYRLLARLTRDEHAAEDLCQETFAAAWIGIGAFKSECSISTWLHKIAYRKFLDFSRSDRKHPVDALVERERSSSPADAVLMDDEARALHESLDQLSGGHRDVLVLHYLHGLTFAQVAELLDEPAGTVRWRAREALAKLREILEHENDHERV